MSVDTLFNKDNRIADTGLEKLVIPKAVQTEQVKQTDSLSTKFAKAQQTDIADKAEQAEKSAISAQAETTSAIGTTKFDINQIRETLEQINKIIPITNTRLVFEFDELGDPPIIKVIDKVSNELIREIPSKDLIKVAKAFNEMADNLNKVGALINYQA
jgi:flagellar protein FlaG